MQPDRRKFIRHTFASAAAMAATAVLPSDIFGRTFHHTKRPEEVILMPEKRSEPKESIRFSVIGINHNHINHMTDALIKGGGEIVSVYSKEPELLPNFIRQYPAAKVAKSEEEILEDNSIQLVASASIPVDRAPLGIRDGFFHR